MQLSGMANRVHLIIIVIIEHSENTPSNELRMNTEDSQKAGRRLVSQLPPFFEAVAAGPCTQNFSRPPPGIQLLPRWTPPWLAALPSSLFRRIHASSHYLRRRQSSRQQRFLPCGGKHLGMQVLTPGRSPSILRCSHHAAQTKLPRPGFYERLHQPPKPKPGQGARLTAWACGNCLFS